MEQEAIGKIQRELKEFRGDYMARVMRDEVARVLTTFCRQDGEFAQAVCQGGSLSDCLKAVAKNVESGLSDLEAYCRAVQFYFPGAQIRMSLSIDLGGGEATPAPAPSSATGIVLDLLDFL